MRTPDEIFGPLFEAVQTGEVFSDSKTFVDCIPKNHPDDIVAAYLRKRDEPGFDLAFFVNDQFDIPGERSTDFTSDGERPIEEHVELLWDVLRRDADRVVPGSSLIPLPHPGIIVTKFSRKLEQSVDISFCRNFWRVCWLIKSHDHPIANPYTFLLPAV